MKDGVNRITGLLETLPDSSTPQSNPRDDALPAGGNVDPVPASSNGRTGKARPKHDALAGVMAPAADPGGQDKLYWEARRGLGVEFKVTAFSDVAMLDSLALDYADLARCRRMIDAVQRPASLPRDEDEKWRRLVRFRREEGIAREVIANFAAGEPASCTSGQAEHLAEEVAAEVDGVRQFISQEDAVPESELEGWELEEFRGYKRLWTSYQPVEQKLKDRERVASVLRGKVCVRGRELKALRLAVGQVADHLRVAHTSPDAQALERRVERVEHEGLRAVLAAPEPLLPLHRYQVELEKSIERKLSDLRRREVSPKASHK